ncbi:uncharacterized protein LOC119731383 [Patiria miniata]|uniref:DUF7041 domain-containing protein n=1 Tax=Patiria miniata TaxID=46514 RepID=A0A914AAT3_PATMI|nr:uncharacterized protein LOC119731383 [Patiria miniata]
MPDPAPADGAAPEGALPPKPVLHPVAAVSLKLPPFWPNDPTLWFAQVEAQFLTRNITTQATRFAYVIASLQPEIAQEVRDLLITPPTTDQYDRLKSELIRRTSLSEQKRLHQLLISEELGDRKPSQLLRRMRQLLGDSSLEDKILKQLFLQRLSTSTQSILASMADSVGIEQLADLADKIVEVSPPSTASAVGIAAPAPYSPPQTQLPQAHPDILVLQDQMASLTRQVQALTTQLQHGQARSRSRGRPKSRTYPADRSPSAPAGRSGDRQCWYHWKFGSKATKCTSPCSRRTPPVSENPQASG